MIGTSMNLEEEKIKLLKDVLPEVFTDGKIDFEKLKATLGEHIDFSNERYVLNWAGKSDAFRTLQSLSTKTLVPSREESLNFDETNNIFIEGENLEVLKILQKSYFGKIKMIYIDPPYNTGNDSFIYPDKFSETLSEYQKRVGDKDEDGYMVQDSMFKKNSKENGQYHSNWLNMMMPRLYLAKNLLRQDGVIFISIDDNEVHNLRLLLNEIFGEENFVAQITREAIKGGSQSKSLRNVHDYILSFAKNLREANFSGYEKEGVELNLKDEYGEYAKGRELNKWGAGSRREDSPSMWFPIISPNNEEVYPIRNDGSEGRWRLGKKKMQHLAENNGIIFEKRKNGTYICYEKIRESKSGIKQFISIFKDNYLNSKGTEELKTLFKSERSNFDYAKPKELIFDLMLMSDCDNSDLVLDFFAGSASTGQAVLEYNKTFECECKYLLIQLPELTTERSEAYKTGYKTIADIAKARLSRVGMNIIEEINEDKQKNQIELGMANQAKIDLGFKVFKLADSNFKQWQQIRDKDSQKLLEQMSLFVDPVAEHATTENMIYEFLLKCGKSLTSHVKQCRDYTSVNDNELILVLETINQNIVTEIIAKNPQKVIALDRLFTGNDQLKTNACLQMKDADIKFETV